MIVERSGGKDTEIDILGTSDLHQNCANVRVRMGNDVLPISIVWMKWKTRRSYPHGLTFSPEREVPGAYNLWRGFTVTPDPDASCALFLDHVWKVICREDEARHRWVMAWMAHCVQRPQEKPGTVTVLRGEQGVGKDTLGQYLGSLFKPHHVTVSNPDQITGRFNAHLGTALLLHVEEGHWAGDRRAKNILKSLITSPTIQIERKGIDLSEMPSFCRLLITSNERWVVPAERGERRYTVLDVSDAKKGDLEYFRAIYYELENGGACALLHHLLNYDFSGINVRLPLETEALLEQKLEGLTNIEAWWRDCLFNGEIRGEGYFETYRWGFGRAVVSRSDIRCSYEQFMRTKRWHGEHLSERQFGKEMLRLCPEIGQKRLTADGERPRAYVIPDLSVCRLSFERIFGEMEWPDDDDCWSIL